MSMSKTIKVKHGKLPTTPGVYLFKDKDGRVVYVGKATNLKSRVGAYFRGVRDQVSGVSYGRPIDEMVHAVARIDWITTDSVIEALILEANLIKKYQPRYNVREKDDKSFLYVVVTKEQWPKVMLVRGSELRETRNSKLETRSEFPVSSFQFHRIFGPYTSASSIRAALDLIRKWFPWSTCRPSPQPSPRGRGGLKSVPSPRRGEGRVRGQSRPCFDYHIGRCPGVCIDAISRREYMKNIRNVVLMLQGKKVRVLKNVEHEMKAASKSERFEEAEKLRRKLFALKHIRDIAVITRDAQLQRTVLNGNKGLSFGGINIFGRIEGYDISNISGTSAVGSMVVFQDGEPAKSAYKRFKIKTVRGINDVAMMREVLERRFAHSNWSMPNLIVIDGGWGQVNVAQEVIDDMRSQGLPDIPIVGIAKGFKRRQDRPIFDKKDPELTRIVENYKDLLLRVRDEAHRFAVSYHRKVRSKRLST